MLIVHWLLRVCLGCGHRLHIVLLLSGGVVEPCAHGAFSRHRLARFAVAVNADRDEGKGYYEEDPD
jgi:hypothetical protein